jgi:glucose-1-phosphate adenylyltransferase
MPAPRILALVLAGGEGRRLRPLTADCAKPAVDIGHGYRIVDFVLANLVNSGVPWIYVIAQYKPVPLIEHLARVWRSPLAKRGCVLRPVLAAGTDGAFKGTADAVYRNLHLLARHEPDLVAVFSADHVYRMDIGQMADFHLGRNADATVAAVPVPVEKAGAFGIIEAAEDGKIVGFQEKPAHPARMPNDAKHAYASMGNYLFDPIVLADLVEATVEGGGTDFGRDLLPRAVRGGARLFAYDFSTNRVPGVKPYEESAYWRDVGTLEALGEARRDLFEGATPRFDLRNSAWPLQPREATRTEARAER